MSTQIPTSFVQQYSSAVRHLVQQRMSRLRGFVDVRTGLTGESAFFEQIGEVTSSKKTGRHQPIEFSDTPHKRRMVTSETYDTADAIDNDDRLRMLIADPAGEYARAQAKQMGRDVDDILITAATGPAQTGKTGSTTVNLPASQKIDVNYVEAGSPANSNLTVGKLRRAKAILLGNEVDEDNLFMAVSSSQLHSLLFDNKLTSADFNTVRALVNGEIDTFMGFRFVRSERLQRDSSDHRRVFAWAREGIALGVWQDVTTRIDPRVDLRTHPMQVYTWMDMGATRMEEKQVVEIACDESADLVST